MTVLHTRWNQKEFSKILGPGSKYVTILRDPSDAFESLYNYAGLGDAFKTSFINYVQYGTLPLSSKHFKPKIFMKTGCIWVRRVSN